MARVIQQMVELGSGEMSDHVYTPRWYALMTDGTLWKFIAGVWTQAPALPGSRVVSAMQIVPGIYDTVYAACTDGTIFSAPVTTPFTWVLVANTPP